MNKYVSRISSSARGEAFNPLTWPFLFSTFTYGIGFIVLSVFDLGGESSLYASMLGLGSLLPLGWGIVAVITIIGGLTFLLFNIPPFGKITGLIGFMLWLFAGFCYILTGAWLPLCSVAIPNMFFWIWQYLSLIHFREEDAADARTMRRYDNGDYDNIDPDINSRQDRLNNRGVDEQ